MIKGIGTFRKTFVSAVFSMVVLGLLGCSLMYFNQENLIFYPEVLPADFKYSFPGRFDELTWPVEGATINVLHFKVEQPKGAILYFHGNAGNLSGWGEIAPDFTGRGYDIFIPDYRGFGKSTGKIRNEKMLHQDAATAYDDLKKHFPENQIILYGRSIGTGLAVYLAKMNKPRMVILESPYYSFLDLAAHHYPLIPRPLLSVLLRYTLRTDFWIPDVSCPVYIFHGTKDEIISYDASERLLRLIKSEHRLIAIPGGGHNDLDGHALYRQQMDRILK